MPFPHVGLRVLSVLAALSLLAACSDPAPRPDVADPSGPTTPGVRLAWSKTVATGTRPFAVVGDTVLLADGAALLGLRRSDGGELWRLPFADGDRFTVAGGYVVVERGRTASFVASEPTDSRSLEVFDAATGSPRWQADGPVRAVVRTDAVYLTRRADRSADPVTTAHEVADGRTRWTAPGVGIANDSIGARLPYAPPSPRYLAATVRGGTVAAVDARSGAVQRGQLSSHDWYALVADQTLVVTDNDPPPSERRCTVAVTSVGVDGTNQRTTTAFSGRQADNSCERALANTDNGQAALGSGTRIAVSSDDGRPQALDLATGAVSWTASTPGVPIDGDDQSLLVRRHADAGDLALLDFASGRQRWTAPDTGLPGTSASWNSAVTGTLVAVAGAVDDHPFVNVYDADTGRLRGRFPSWLAAAGDGWVAVTHGNGTADQLIMEFWRF
jgi:PQQ-like domain